MADPETLAILKSIDQSLRTLVTFARAEAEARVVAKIQKPTNDKSVASEAELDQKWGDPEVRFTPRDWTGEPMKGRKMSECPAEFLDVLADTFDYFAGKAEESGELYNGKPTAPYKRKDAARARGWALRIRSGWRAPVRSNADDWS